MLNTVKILGLTGLIALPAVAFGAVSPGDSLGTTEVEIRAALEAEGYVVQEIEFEGDEIEVEVLYDGVELELELARDTGILTEIETEDDDD